MNTFTPTIIFSAWQHVATEGANRDNVTWCKRILAKSNIGFLVGEGCYKGEHEPCLIVHDFPDSKALNVVRALCRAFKQESILRIDANGQGRLETRDGELIESIGKFHMVPEKVAHERDAWTRLGDRFFVGTSIPAPLPAPLPNFKGVNIHG